jgi:hypothetical protein
MEAAITTCEESLPEFFRLLAIRIRSGFQKFSAAYVRGHCQAVWNVLTCPDAVLMVWREPRVQLEDIFLQPLVSAWNLNISYPNLSSASCLTTTHCQCRSHQKVYCAAYSEPESQEVSRETGTRTRKEYDFQRKLSYRPTSSLRWVQALVLNLNLHKTKAELLEPDSAVEPSWQGCERVILLVEPVEYWKELFDGYVILQRSLWHFRRS